jgi:preprotein translocase subunit SecG
MSGQNGLFTARGGSNVLTKATWVIASLFIGNCLLMTFLSSHHSKGATSFLGKDSQSFETAPVQSHGAKSEPAAAQSTKQDQPKK